MEPIFYQDPSEGGFAGTAGARRGVVVAEDQQYHKLPRHQRAAFMGTMRAIGRNSMPSAPQLDALPPPQHQHHQQQQGRGEFCHRADSNSMMMAPTAAGRPDSNDDDGETSSASEDSAPSAGYPSPLSRASGPTISSSIGGNKRPAADGGSVDHLPPAQRARMRSMQDATTRWSPVIATGTSSCSTAVTSPGSTGSSRDQQRQLPRLAALEARPLAGAPAAAPTVSQSQLQHHLQQQQMIMQQNCRAGEVKITPLMQLGGLPPSLLNNHSNNDNGRISPQHRQQQVTKASSVTDSPLLVAEQQQRRGVQQRDNGSATSDRRTHIKKFQSNVAAAAALSAGADPYDSAGRCGEVPPSPSWSCHSSHSTNHPHSNNPRLPRQIPRLESLGDDGSAFSTTGVGCIGATSGSGATGMQSPQGRWDPSWSAAGQTPRSSGGNSFDHSNDTFGTTFDQGYGGSNSRHEEFPRQQQQQQQQQQQHDSREEAGRLRERRSPASSTPNVLWDRKGRETMVVRGGMGGWVGVGTAGQLPQQRGSSLFERYHHYHNEPHAFIRQQPRTVLSNHRPESNRTPQSVPSPASRTAENAEQPRWSPASEPNLVTGSVQQQQPQSRLPRRGAKQILESYVTHLNPKASREVWSHDEEEVLWRAQHEYGNAWSYIAGLLPGRSENAVKNHWYTQMRMFIGQRGNKAGANNSNSTAESTACPDYKSSLHSAKGNNTRQARPQKKHEEEPLVIATADRRPRKSEECQNTATDKGVSAPTSPISISSASGDSGSASPTVGTEEVSATRAESDARAEAVAALGMLFSQGHGRRLVGNNKDSGR